MSIRHAVVTLHRELRFEQSSGKFMLNAGISLEMEVSSVVAGQPEMELRLLRLDVYGPFNPAGAMRVPKHGLGVDDELSVHSAWRESFQRLVLEPDWASRQGLPGKWGDHVTAIDIASLNFWTRGLACS